MSIIQAVIGSIVSGSSATPTYTLTPTTNNVNEGASLNFTVGGTDIPDGTYYWTIDLGGDFATASGTVSVSGNSGSFSVTPTEDATTEGAETFTVALREGSITGTILATSVAVTINDTSLTPVPVPPFSLEFVQAQTDYLDVAASSDWNLGTTWTIEFWSKAIKVSTAGDLLAVMCQNYDVGGSIDLVYWNGQLSVANSTEVSSEPTPNTWTHVALVSDGANLKVYYNGSSVYTGGVYTLNNATDPIRIGARGPIDIQRFDGLLALIRISNTAKYAGTFTPSNNYGVGADTKLFLGTDNPLVDSVSHTITNNGVALSNDVPPMFYTLSAVAYDFTHGYDTNYGGNSIWVLIADYPDIVTVPDGAFIVVSGQGAGTYISGEIVTISGKRRLATLIPSYVWGGDTLTITWIA